MKNIIYIAISIFIMSGCNNREDYFFNNSSSPILKIFNPVSQSLTTETIIDSAKKGVMYITNYTLSSETAVDVHSKQMQGNDSIGIEGDKIYIMPKTQGISKVDIIATNKLSKSSNVGLYLTIFNNLLPVSRFTAEQVQGGLSPFEINIDASQSFDKDAKWGGKIVAYKYKINTNYEVISELPGIRYICETSGQKKIAVSVQDNNGAWSSEQTVYLILE